MKEYRVRVETQASVRRVLIYIYIDERLAEAISPSFTTTNRSRGNVVVVSECGR